MQVITEIDLNGLSSVFPNSSEVFTFHFQNNDVSVHPFYAELLSPFILQERAADPKFLELTFDFPYNPVFEKVTSHYLNGQSVKIEQKDFNFLKNVLFLLGNNDLLSCVIEDEISDRNNALESLLFAYNSRIYNIEKQVKAVAENFIYLRQRIIAEDLDFELIHEILSSPYIIIEDEDHLFSFVCALINKYNEKAYTFIQYVNPRTLSPTCKKDYFTMSFKAAAYLLQKSDVDNEEDIQNFLDQWETDDVSDSRNYSPKMKIEKSSRVDPKGIFEYIKNNNISAVNTLIMKTKYKVLEEQSPDVFHLSPFAYAIKQRNKEIYHLIKYVLLSSDAVQNFTQPSLFSEAIIGLMASGPTEDRYEILEELIKLGGSINYRKPLKDGDFTYALLVCIDSKSFKMLSYLIENSDRLDLEHDVLDNDGRNFLSHFFANYSKYYDEERKYIFSLPFIKSYNIETKDKRGKTPRDYLDNEIFRQQIDQYYLNIGVQNEH